VAKALALECMRAAKEQDRACYMFAFAGPAEVRAAAGLGGAVHCDHRCWLECVRTRGQSTPPSGVGVCPPPQPSSLTTFIGHHPSPHPHPLCPTQVREVELNQDMRSVNNLLDFLEKVFNGGSDFNEPVKRCLERLTDARWANSDILLVSDGELRQPAQEVGAEAWGHGVPLC
jgi:hypothetical protein